MPLQYVDHTGLDVLDISCMLHRQQVQWEVLLEKLPAERQHDKLFLQQAGCISKEVFCFLLEFHLVMEQGVVN